MSLPCVYHSHLSQFLRGAIFKDLDEYLTKDVIIGTKINKYIFITKKEMTDFSKKYHNSRKINIL